MLGRYCDGVSGACPVDGTVGAGLECDLGYDPGMCYLGYCYSPHRQCYEEGTDLDGAPFSECPYESTVRLNGWIEGDEASMEAYACSTLWCQNDPSSCTYYRISGQVSYTNDGTPCSLAGGKQCKNKECLPSADLNVEYSWVGSPWTDCDECDELQSRTTFCENINFPGVPVNELLCSSNSILEESQLCDNATLACTHNQEYETGYIDFFGFATVSVNTVLFGACGVVSGLLILLAICYQAVVPSVYDYDNEDSSEQDKKEAEAMRRRQRQREDAYRTGNRY